VAVALRTSRSFNSLRLRTVHPQLGACHRSSSRLGGGSNIRFTAPDRMSSISAGLKRMHRAEATAVVELATSISSPSRPAILLIHGLDSSKQTWTSVAADLTSIGYPVLAVDLRGHGESPLGDANDFGPAALATDVLSAARGSGASGPFVVVGHSMGGRVAMRLAAMEPSAVACLVVEDMDVRPRQVPQAVIDLESSAAMDRFRADSGRRFESWEEAKAALAPWYDEERMESWKGARIRQALTPASSSSPSPGQASWWWSDVNPMAMTLAYRTVLASRDGGEAWAELAALTGAGGRPPFPIHLWVADPSMTVCNWDGPGGISTMKASVPVAEVREWPGAAHSIHNTARPEFVAELKRLADQAASWNGLPKHTS